MVARGNRALLLNMEGDEMTQNEMVLRHMQEIGWIDPMTALGDYGIMRLASRISELRGMGIPIKREMVHHTNRFGETVKYARYGIDR